MKRLNLTYFMQLGAALNPLTQVPVRNGGFDPNRFKRSVFSAQYQLRGLIQDDTIPLAIPASRPVARRLAKALQESAEKKELVEQDAWDILWDAEKLQTLLEGELAVQTVYHIWPKRAYDTNLLIDKAVSLFSKQIQSWFTPEETYNVSEAGKCLAFETPTAAGFHLIRATESVIRRYYAVVVGKPPKPKMRNWGAYLRVLKDCGADTKVLQALEQVKDLHRNPVIHPEFQLSLDEALSLLGIVESVISAIHIDMTKREDAAKPPSLFRHQSLAAALLTELPADLPSPKKEQAS
ncbi:MAG: hypothetical protein L0Z53_01990 [Acidobacteriales bacterium]|nr:hypothetical protein [Terriglobales bacterium]